MTNLTNKQKKNKIYNYRDKNYKNNQMIFNLISKLILKI